MSDRSSVSSKYETNVLGISTAGTVRVNKLANIDYFLIATSIVLFILGTVLLVQTRRQTEGLRLTKKLVLAVLLMVSAVALRPLFDYLVANNPNAPLFS